MHILRELSFLQTNNTGAPRGEVLGMIKLFSNRSRNYSFKSLSSVGAILVGGSAFASRTHLQGVYKAHFPSFGMILGNDLMYSDHVHDVIRSCLVQWSINALHFSCGFYGESIGSGTLEPLGIDFTAEGKSCKSRESNIQMVYNDHDSESLNAHFPPSATILKLLKSLLPLIRPLKCHFLLSQALPDYLGLLIIAPSTNMFKTFRLYKLSSNKHLYRIDIVIRDWAWTPLYQQQELEEVEVVVLFSLSETVYLPHKGQGKVCVHPILPQIPLCGITLASVPSTSGSRDFAGRCGGHLDDLGIKEFDFNLLVRSLGEILLEFPPIEMRINQNYEFEFTTAQKQSRKMQKKKNNVLRFSAYKELYGLEVKLRFSNSPDPNPLKEKKKNNLGEMMEEYVSVPGKDLLIQLFMTALQTINSVFCSMNQSNKEENRDILYRLLIHAKSQIPALLTMGSKYSSVTYKRNWTTVPCCNSIYTGTRNVKSFQSVELDAPLSKRQRSEQTDSIIVSDVRPLTGNGVWLEDTGTAGLPITSSTDSSDNDIRKLEQVTTSVATIPSVIVNADENLPLTGMSTSTTLHSLLKDIAINPSIWMNIIKMEQQKSADASRTTAQASISSSILGAVPSTDVVAPRTSVIGQKSVGILQTPTQTAAVASSIYKLLKNEFICSAKRFLMCVTGVYDEGAIVRMKPRDPRRALHNTAVLKGGNVGSDQCKTGVAGTQAMTSNLCVQRQEDQLDRKSAVTLSTTPPDIAHQFTKNLKNIADMISVSPSTSPSAASRTATQHIQVYQSRLEGKGTVSESSERLNDAGLASEKGSLQPQTSWGDVEHLFEGYSDQQRADIQKERARRLQEQKKMFAVRKLCLVLDLDHTLLNSAKARIFIEIDPVHEEILRKKEEQDREKPYRHIFRFPHMGMWTKLRPGIWNFLEKASNLFELHLYTMGNKLYATEMAKLLDPKGDLFAGRVISRGDDGDPFDGDERVPKSKDLEGVLGMESAVVIIDDSVRVWPHNKLNLIVVERYIYFPCSRRQFGLPGPSLLEIDHDERPEDGTLASCLGVIQRIHQNFFTHRSIDEADVRNILATEQQKILAGCRIVFSRVFPVGEANPHLHPLWQTAEQFGAVCTSQIDEQVTHVVANSPGTDKVNWALSTGRFVVHPGWVEASALLYRRANEHDFAIKP
ncbi:hypothetical protein RND71_039533 [Anisodus tanguticus]|uniref:protein-serine/threonine phosphatase n=1 Tax=Anisodus tanguticus TaxID=243964 RepID=A0AAE1US32_9SOLA|nr:hypothetical protein RND71_039533 [Anisodus tanguticus]